MSQRAWRLFCCVLLLAASTARAQVLLLPISGERGEDLRPAVREALRESPVLGVTELPRRRLLREGSQGFSPLEVVRLSKELGFKVAVSCERKQWLRCRLIRPDGALESLVVMPLRAERPSVPGLRLLRETLEGLLGVEPGELEAAPQRRSFAPGGGEDGVYTFSPQKLPEVYGPAEEGALSATSPRAVRLAGPVAVDGEVRDEEWRAVPAFTQLTTTYPQPGPPAQRTEVRVAYDEEALYLAVVCFDREPDAVLASLGRRDNPGVSDKVVVMLDTARDRQTAYYFGINAGGVQEDGVITDDVNGNQGWDGVWEGASRLREDGWSAELRIPFSQLRLSSDEQQVWGFNVRRAIGRTGQQLDTSPIPRKANVFVSRFGELTGVSVKPPRELLLRPFLAARAFLRPSEVPGAPRLLNPSGDVGVDLKAALSGSLVLSATFNPDFGELEADEVELNFRTVELFRPEKRAFFNEGADVFLPVGARGGQSSQMLFYSRRVGLDTPILAAAKLSGSIGKTQLGLLDAVVMGPANPSPDADPPDRRVELHPERPLHLSLNDELPAEKPISKNLLVALLRQEVGPVTVGATYAGALPFGGCAGLQACPPRGSHAAAVDVQARSENGEWGLLAQLDGSRQTGGPAQGTVLADGTLLRDGTLGYGGYLRGGKTGGEHFQLWAELEYASPTLELNQLGYLANQNRLSAMLCTRIIQPFAGLEDFALNPCAWIDRTTDARALPLASGADLAVNLVTAGHHSINLYGSYQVARRDTRELRGSGVALQRPDLPYVDLSFNTDPARALSVGGSVNVLDPHGVRRRLHFGATAWATLRPHPRFELSVSAKASQPQDSPYYVFSPEPGRFVLADLEAVNHSTTVRASLLFTPALSFQLSAQLFTGFGVYGPFYEGLSSGPTVMLDSLTPATNPPEPFGYVYGALRATAVLRWEYRAGSTLLLVFSRSQESAPPSAVQRRLWPEDWQGPTTDGLMLKWSHAFGG